MATPIDALYFQLGVDSSQLASGLNRARAMMQTGVQNIVSALAAPMMTALGGIASGAVVSSFIDQAEAARKLSDQLHVNMEDLQAWSNAAERAGGSAAGFQSSLTAIKSRLADFQTAGNMGAAQTFAMMGLPISGNPLDIMERLAERAETMGKMRFESWAKRVGLDAGTISFLQKGRAEIELLIKRQKEIGVYTKEDAEIARRARNAFLDLGQALKMGGGMIARIILPALEKLSDAMTDGIIYLRKHQPFVLAFLGLVTAGLTKMAISAAVAFAPFLAIGAVFAGLALLIDDLVVYIQGGESALEAFWSQFGSGKEILESLKVAWADLKAIFQSFVREAIISVQLLVEKFQGVVEPIKELYTNLFKAIISVWKGDFREAGRALREAFESAFEAVKQILLGLFDILTDKIRDLFSFDGLKEIAGKTWEFLSGFAEGEEEVKKKVLISSEAPAQAVPATSYNFATTNAQKNTSVNSRATFGDIYITSTATDGYQLGQDFLSAVSDPLQGMSFNVNSGVSQ